MTKKIIHPDEAARRAWQSFFILLGGMLGLVVAMGIGRFVFTPILPLMQRDLGLSHGAAGWLAGLNYLGYLVGALACSLAPARCGHRLVGIAALLASIATTFFMAMTQTLWVWGMLRLVGGIASALLFILISSEVADALARRRHLPWFGALYGGVGLGIALSGSLVPVFDKVGGWQGTWIGSGLIAVLLAALGVALGRRRGSVPAQAVATDSAGGRGKPLWPLAVAYFFEGLGYVVTATFLVAIVAAAPGMAHLAPYAWVAVGLAAMPSTLLWPRFARRVGTRFALLAAFALQATGILAGIGAESMLLVAFSAFSFGATFMGIVALVMAEGGRRMPFAQRRSAAVLTACFGIGQMLGPPAAGVLADLHHGFGLPLLLAALAIGVGAVFIALDRGFSDAPQP
ncbi:YbfB/YjiJ family MFS transporter [Geoalkalibacter subterraneus]|uniref:YbfB/YjiJ family MFS transporter n=1 Tax=Geoalkalibacter subterraneus TaxID=483547 RepID=UPI000693F06A|nr:YbfB/YjiJ family MFS transporter [Geoalkalibacter subterraneus]